MPSAIFPGLFDFLSSLSLKRKLKTKKIDIKKIEVIHAHVTSSGIYTIYLKKYNTLIKTILQHHGLDVLSLENGILSNKNWHRNWVKKYGISICNHIDLHIGVSKITIDHLLAFPKIKIKSHFVLYNGVDTNKFYPVLGIKHSNYFTIGCVANFWTLKDHITLIKAIQTLVNKGNNFLKIIFIGSGPTLQLCQNYVEEYNLNNYCEFNSEKDHFELNNFYNSLDLFVLPSYYEAFGCVYTEAYACGVPFMAVKNQGIAELLSKQDESHWLIDKGDYKKLADLIKQYIINRTKQSLIIDIEINNLIRSLINRINEFN